MIHCKCIVQVCKILSRNPYDVRIIHPLYHIQRHPGWLLALKQAIQIEDYYDFPFNNHSFISRISHSFNPVGDSLTTSHTETILSDRYQLGPLKTKYYDQIEIKCLRELTKCVSCSVLLKPS
jgi:hypothetical protein